MRCPACEHDNPERAKFCSECGARLPAGCPSCGAELADGAKFCSECGALVVSQPEPPKAAPMPSSFVNGRYAVQRFLGEGGKKRVYLCRDTRLDRDVAFSLIKTDGLDATSIERIEREAQLMARLGDHPHIVSLFDLGEEAGQPYLVSQLMPGGDVEGLIEQAPEHRPPLADTLRIAEQVCRALEYAHSHGVVHRDLKPGNVWLTADGTAKLGDFGLAVAIDKTRLSVAGMIVGTVAYMPPEQAMGRAPDARSDLYSLGAMLYELTTGRPPFLGDDPVAIISQHVNTAPVAPSWHNPELPRPLEALILRLLAKDPGQRPASAAEVRAALAAIAPAAPPASTDLPQRQEANPLDRLAAGVFVGRERELEAARAALDGALAGRGQVLLVVGEPGIGKTRLVEELGTYAAVRGAQVLWGRCYEWEGAPAYWPWVQLIRGYVHEADPQALRSELGQGAAAVATVVSEVREQLPGLPELPALDPEAARFRLFDSIMTFLKNAARRQPLVLVLDDLHWADRPSLLLLEFISRELGRDRLLLVGTYRDVEVGRQHPLSQTLAELSRGRTGQRVLLRGLPRDEVGRFIAMTAGVTPPEGLVEAVHRETEGNPFFVAEVVRLLVAEGRLERPRADRTWSVSIPESVREVIGLRLNRLADACNQVLTVASVVGREFRLTTLERVTGRPTDELLDLLEEAAQARLIHEQEAVGQYRFSHALVQETLYEELSSARRARLHGQIGDAIAQAQAANLPPYLGELAHHYFEAAAAGKAEQAIDYAVRAAERALEQLAWETAISFYQQAVQALEFLPSTDDGRRCDLMLALGAVQWLGGDVTASTDSYRNAAEIARALHRPDRFARAALGFAGGDHPGFAMALPGQAALLDEGLSLLPREDSVVRARLLGRLGMTLAFEGRELPRARSLVDGSVEMAQRLGNDRLLFDNLYERWCTIADPGSLDDRKVLANQLRELITNDATDQMRMGADNLVCMNALESGERETTDDLLINMERLAVEARLPAWMGAAVGRKAMRSVADGRFAEAERQIVRTRELLERFQGSEGFWLMPLVMLRREQGRLSEIDDLLAEWNVAYAIPIGGSYARSLRALVDCELGRLDEARTQIKALSTRDFAGVAPGQFWAPSLALIAEVAAIIGDVGTSAYVHQALSPFPSLQVHFDGNSIWLGACSRFLGLLSTTLERFDDAERHFVDAVAMNERMGARIFTARTLYDFATMLARRDAPDDRKRALALLDDALAAADGIGMTRLSQQALALKVRVQRILNA